MNDYRSTSEWSGQKTRRAHNSSDSLSFIRRQPQFILAGALLAGALLAMFTQKKGWTTPRLTSSARDASWGQPHQPLYRAPSAYMGATEEQMAPRSTLSTPGLESGTAGVTGSIYELDPASVTPG